MILIDRCATLILYCIVTAQNDVSLLNDVNRIALNQAEREAYSLFVFFLCMRAPFKSYGYFSKYIATRKRNVSIFNGGRLVQCKNTNCASLIQKNNRINSYCIIDSNRNSTKSIQQINNRLSLF